MRNAEIRNTVAELQELYAAQDVLKAQITEREQAIKDELDAREIETLDLGNVIIRWTSQVADRLSTRDVREYLKSMNVLDNFIKTVYSKRFSIA